MVASSRESGFGAMTVCQTCGNRGEARLLIFCIKCNDSAVHHYCLDEFDPDDDNITWKCEECEPKVAKVSPFRKSERIIEKEDQAWNVQMDLKKKLNKNSSSTAQPVYVEDKIAESVALANDYSIPPLSPSRSQPSIEPDNPVYAAAQPVIDPIWRDENVFDALLEDINEHNLALKTTINEVDLLIFSSLELPREHWRFRRKYYLWGVFRQIKHTNQAKSSNMRCIADSTSLRGSNSPFSTGSSCHESNTLKSQLPYARTSSPNSLSSHSSKCFQLDNTEEI
ncbi:hypothetical protein LguiA_003907 [Lonicera macranthoides]